MKKNNKKEKGAALINVMLIVLLAVAIGLPLLYLVIVNFTFRMFDNNLRSISYMNEMGMDNVYAIIQEVVIGKTATARDKAKEIVIIDALPLTPFGKVDYRKLEQFEFTNATK